MVHSCLNATVYVMAGVISSLCCIERVWTFYRAICCTAFGM